MKAPLFTIGQGRRTVEELCQELQDHQIQFLIDVRSMPKSKYRPEFSRRPLSEHLQKHGVRYVFMGDTLGGRPNDPTCYAEDGKLDYEVYGQTDSFQRGLARLFDASDKGCCVCLFCAEGDPARCHRAKLIGDTLQSAGYSVMHIVADGALLSHSDLRLD